MATKQRPRSFQKPTVVPDEPVEIVPDKPVRKPKVTGPEPIDLNVTGAVFSVLQMAMQNDGVRIALGSFLEGRGLTGEWRLEVTGARLVPA